MDDSKFKYLIDNQKFWRELYIKQEKKANMIRKEINKKKNWYGNSSEYKKEWDANNKRHTNIFKIKGDPCNNL